MPSPFTYYPLHDFGPIMKGMIIGGMGIFHVFLAQFAIGGGMLMCYLQWMGMRGKEPLARSFLDGYFKILVLISFVVGALTGVGMWLTSIQISPRTIGMMVGEFHWIWATEWTFFCLETVSGYCFYRYGKLLDDATRLKLLLLYAFAAWMSLFWINGILAWQLTPGAWSATEPGPMNVWAGFFNPSFWPSLLFRTIVAMTLGSLVACIVINTMSVDQADKRRLINQCTRFLGGMVFMPALGYWFMMVIPPDARTWILGGSIAMTLFFSLAVGASMLIGVYGVVGLIHQRLYVNGATATLLLALAFGATAGGEFVREGVRKPYSIRDTLYSNSIRPDQVAAMRVWGCIQSMAGKTLVVHDPYPLPTAEIYPNKQIQLGVRVYRMQCSVCHTIDGANGLTHLAGAWDMDQQRMMIARLQFSKTFMPPFAGTPEELEALVQMLNWEVAKRPAKWPEAKDQKAVLEKIKAWLDEAGTGPGTKPRA